MKAKFNEEKNTLKVNGKKFNVLSVKTELKVGDLKNGEWVNNKRYVTFEIGEMEEQPEAPESPEAPEAPEAPETPEQPQRKFKAGDKVRIKDGISSETHMDEPPSFIPYMDELIGKELTVKGRSPSGHIQVLKATCVFAEDWLEPWSDEKEELKDGDLAIFWDGNPEYARIAAFLKKEDGLYFDSDLIGWLHAVKFECTKEQREQFNKVRKGEITL